MSHAVTVQPLSPSNPPALVTFLWEGCFGRNDDGHERDQGIGTKQARSAEEERERKISGPITRFLSTHSVGWDWNLPILTWEQNACLWQKPNPSAYPPEGLVPTSASTKGNIDRLTPPHRSFCHALPLARLASSQITLLRQVHRNAAREGHLHGGP
ncbi:unnamed protein product [Ectocarpus sp. 8 AP-2014]